jgi:hypothetical protein
MILHRGDLMILLINVAKPIRKWEVADTRSIAHEATNEIL